MPRSSRHKSSKHSSREARDYSDSEKDSSVKDRKSKEESSARVSKESSSGEKRKLDLKDKDSFATGNGEYVEEYSSSKRRKERVDDSVNDRWNGGDDDRGEATRKLKEKSSDSRSKRRDGSLGAYGEGEDVVKKSSGKSEGKHRDSSSRRESRDGGAERERERERDRDREKERDREREKKGKESKDVKGERLVDVDDKRLSKQVSDKTDSNAHNLLQSPESDNQHDRRIRRKRDGSGDGDRHHDSVGDVIGKQLSLKEDAKDVRLKDDKHKDERFRGKHHEDADRENRHREDKQRDERASRDRANNRSDERHMRDEKDTIEIRQKKPVPLDGDQDHDRDFDIGRDGNWDREYYHRDRELDSDRERERDRDRDHLHDRDRDRDWDLDRERDKEREQERDRVRDRDRNADYDRTYFDDRSSRYKDSRGKKRSPDDFDDYDDVKHKGVRNSADNEKKSSSKVEADADRGRSQARQSHVDNISNSRRRLSPNSSSHGASDDYRSSKAEDLKYRDSPAEQRTQATSLREGTGFSSERVSKYRSSEKPIKMDDGNLGELSVERSSSSKASPKGLADKSPSSSLERRYMNRNAVRRSLEIEESGRRSRDSMGARDLPSTEDRSSREMPLDESMPSDTSFYNRSSQSNSALIPPSSFRGGVGSPSFMGSVEEDGRVNTGGRYKRSGDPIPGRGQGNAWRGAQNWSSPVPNGYIPFQHGPSHGGFQAMMPQFPSPPLFGVRPPMDMNHSGIPYHMPDADRFSGHLRPLGWQNMMDGSGPAHMHGWDGNNGVFRDEAHFYGGPEWDQNRHPVNGRGWETGADLWKGQNGDLPSTPLKEDATVHAPTDDISVGQTGQRSQKENNNNGVHGKDTETKPAMTSIKESSKISLKSPNEKMLDPFTLSSEDNVNISCAYLSKLDISEELASPELYKQGISLLNKEERTTDSEDTAMLVNLKDGARVIAKSSSTLWSSSLFPATNNSVFQKALNIYKKQRVCVNGLPIVNGEIIDVILASNMKDEIPNSDVDKIEESNLRRGNVEMPDAALPDIDEKAEAARDMDEKSEAVPVTATNEKPEQMVLDPGSNSDANVDTPHVKSELPNEACSHSTPKLVQDDSQDKVDGILPEMVRLENSQDDPMTDNDKLAQTASDLPTNEQGVDDIAEMKGNDYLASSEEGKGGGDALSGPLIFSDGSPNASGTLMPESNESESVILSRIHHSPESTH